MDAALLMGASVVVGLLIAALALWSHHRTRQQPQTGRPMWHRVVRVVDGDTVRVHMSGVEVPVRVLGIDTPETVHPHKPVERYGPESTQEARRLLEGQYVRLDTDLTRAQHVDMHGRLLAYITLPDGTDYGHHMIAAGYARENTFAGQRYTRQQQYRDAELAAWAAGRGQWSMRHA